VEDTRTEAQRHYDAHGYYERQSAEARHDSTFLAWARDMDNTPRAERDVDPKRSGTVEWLRFIHEWLTVAPEGQHYFTEDGQLWIDPVGQLTSDGRRLYAETYFNRPPDRDDENGRRGFTFRPVFRLFLDNAHSYARLECYSEALTQLCDQVWANVQASYQPLHPAVTLAGGNVPEHLPGAYPRLGCCGGPVVLR
jgi:hypothetical protein